MREHKTRQADHDSEQSSDQVPNESARNAKEEDRSDPASSEELFALLYDELRKIAHRLFSRERPGHTLQPTALVNEAYLKLAGQQRSQWKSRTHFLAVSAQSMRRLLVDHARKRGAKKRGSSAAKVDLSNVVDRGGHIEYDIDLVLSVDEAVDKLAEYDERQALIVTLRFFGGLTVDEVAETIGISPRTVALHWRHAKAWLQIEITRSGE